MPCIGYNIAIQSKEGREAQKRTTVLDFWTEIKPAKMKDKADKIVIVFQVDLLAFFCFYQRESAKSASLSALKTEVRKS